MISKRHVPAKRGTLASKAKMQESYLHWSKTPKGIKWLKDQKSLPLRIKKAQDRLVKLTEWIREAQVSKRKDRPQIIASHRDSKLRTMITLKKLQERLRKPRPRTKIKKKKVIK